MPPFNRVIDDQLATAGAALPDDLGIGVASVEYQKINALVYAIPGVGKTTFAETANDHPDLAPALFFNLEGGLLSVARRRPNKIDIESVDHLETLLHLYAQGDPRLTRFKTLIMDSASELQRVSLQSHIAGRQRGNRNRDMNDINRDDYGRMTVQLGRVLCMMRDLPVNTVITAHPTFVYPDGERSGDPDRVFPAFTPRLAGQVMGFYDFVWYMYMVVENDVETRYILTNKRGAYEAKTRGPHFRAVIGDRFQNPTLPVLYQLLLDSESAHPGDQGDMAGQTAAPLSNGVAILSRPSPTTTIISREPSTLGPNAQLQDRDRDVDQDMAFGPNDVTSPMDPNAPVFSDDEIERIRSGSLTVPLSTVQLAEAEATGRDPYTGLPNDGRPGSIDPEAAPVAPESTTPSEAQPVPWTTPVAPSLSPVRPRVGVRPRIPTPTSRAMEEAKRQATATTDSAMLTTRSTIQTATS